MDSDMLAKQQDLQNKYNSIQWAMELNRSKEGTVAKDVNDILNDAVKVYWFLSQPLSSTGNTAQ